MLKVRGLPPCYQNGAVRPLTVAGVTLTAGFKQGKPVAVVAEDGEVQAARFELKNDGLYIAKLPQGKLGCSRADDMDGNVWFFRQIADHAQPSAEANAALAKLMEV